MTARCLTAGKWCSMNRLKTVLGSIELDNPVLCTSGCFGYGYESVRFTDVSKIGAVSTKTVLPNLKTGNPPPRIHEVPAAVLTSIGLQNPGFKAFMRDVYPKTCEVLRPGQRFISVAGDSPEEYMQITAELSDMLKPGEIAAIEVNVACPNVSCGGASLSKFPDTLNKLIRDIVDRVAFPVVVKFTTMFDNYCDAAKAIEDGGAQAVYTSNTPLGMAIDIERGLPVMYRMKAPISGPAIRPLGVGITWDIYKAIKIPLIASGGIACWQDALEYMMAGATAIGIGCASFVEPNKAVEVIDGLAAYAEEKGLANINEIVGLAHRNVEAQDRK